MNSYPIYRGALAVFLILCGLTLGCGENASTPRDNLIEQAPGTAAKLRDKRALVELHPSVDVTVTKDGVVSVKARPMNIAIKRDNVLRNAEGGGPLRNGDRASVGSTNAP
jgi:hypothetical protein